MINKTETGNTKRTIKKRDGEVVRGRDGGAMHKMIETELST